MSEIYRGWKIESHNHHEYKFKYFDLKWKNEVVLGEDISQIKKQIDYFLNQY